MAGAQILALDLATVTGWCIGRIGERPRFGTWRLKSKDDEPERASRNLGCRLRDILSVESIDVIAYEAAISAGGVIRMGSASRTADMLLQLPGAVQAVAGCYGVFTTKKHVQSVRKAFLGVARPEFPKEAVIAHCRSLGFDVSDDNAADAIAIWYAQSGYSHAEATKLSVGAMP